MRALVQRFISRYRDLEAVAALSERELADMGLSREQAMHLASLPRDVPERVAAMARIFGVTEAELQRDRNEWLELLEVCDGCHELPACRRLMMLGDFATPGETGFCPNRDVFERHAPSA